MTGGFLITSVMTPIEEKFVSQGVCPHCLPVEGRAEKMKLLGDFGPIRSYQCRRCSKVFAVAKPSPKNK